MANPDEIFAAAAALPATDKWMLVTRLWATLPAEAWDAPSDLELAEVQRRSAEYDRGEVTPIERDEVRQRIRNRLAGNG
jgi:putative addiction module component (TIGR02574 family)